MNIYISTDTTDKKLPVAMYINISTDHYTRIEMTPADAIRYGSELIRKAEALNATAVAEKRALELGLAALRILTAPVVVPFAIAAE